MPVRGGEIGIGIGGSGGATPVPRDRVILRGPRPDASESLLHSAWADDRGNLYIVDPREIAATDAQGTWTDFDDPNYDGALNRAPSGIGAAAERFYYDIPNHTFREFQRLGRDPAGDWYSVNAGDVITNGVLVGEFATEQEATNAIADHDAAKTYVAFWDGAVHQLTGGYVAGTGAEVTYEWVLANASDAVRDAFDAATIPDATRAVYLSQSGDDANDGRTPEKPVATLAIANIRAVEAFPGRTRARFIVVLDASVMRIDEHRALSPNTSIWAPLARVEGSDGITFSPETTSELVRGLDRFNILSCDSVRLGRNRHLTVDESTADITIQANRHSSTVLRISRLMEGTLAFQSGITGVIRLQIDSVYDGFVLPDPPAGLTLNGWVGERILGGEETGFVPRDGGSFTGAVSGIAPTEDAHFATKAYADTRPGLRGEKGDPGETGPQGRQGERGEPGSDADLDAAEIKARYESNPDTNAFTDAEQTKLAGIESEATADQTAEEIRDALQGLAGDDRLDAGAVKNLQAGNGGAAATRPVVSVTAERILRVADRGKHFNVSISPASETLDLLFEPAATLSNGWWRSVKNLGPGGVALFPDGTETVDGEQSSALDANASAVIVCDGSAFTLLRSFAPLSASAADVEILLDAHFGNDDWRRNENPTDLYIEATIPSEGAGVDLPPRATFIDNEGRQFRIEHIGRRNDQWFVRLHADHQGIDPSVIGRRLSIHKQIDGSQLNRSGAIIFNSGTREFEFAGTHGESYPLSVYLFMTPYSQVSNDQLPALADASEILAPSQFQVRAELDALSSAQQEAAPSSLAVLAVYDPALSLTTAQQDVQLGEAYTAFERISLVGTQSSGGHVNDVAFAHTFETALISADSELSMWGHVAEQLAPVIQGSEDGLTLRVRIRGNEVNRFAPPDRLVRVVGHGRAA